MLPRRSLRMLLALTTALLLMATLSPAVLADRRDFNINNASDYVIKNAYVAASSSDSWGDDILGRDVLNPGETWQVGFDRGDTPTCLWDVKVITTDGLDLRVSNVDLCTVTDVNVRNQ